MDIWSHELEAYKREVDTLSKELKSGVPDGENSTHFGLGLSNRANMILIGLCSLVEAFLYEIAAEEETKNSLKIVDVKGRGLKKLKTYLALVKRIDFNKIRTWNYFNQIYILRNALVHGYGGLVDSTDMTKVEKAIKILKMPSLLFLRRRIRISSESLSKLLAIVEETVENLKAVIATKP